MEINRRRCILLSNQAQKARPRQKGSAAREQKSTGREERPSRTWEGLAEVVRVQVQHCIQRLLEEYVDRVKSPTVSLQKMVA
jgi:hypothetical protein